MPYMVTFTINIPPNVSIYIPYMDPMGNDAEQGNLATLSIALSLSLSVWQVWIV